MKKSLITLLTLLSLNAHSIELDEGYKSCRILMNYKPGAHLSCKVALKKSTTSVKSR